MAKPSEFETALNKFLDTSLDRGDRDSLKRSLNNAKAAAKEREIYSQSKGYESYFTIKAALDLAVAVWEEEKKRRKAG